MESMTGYSYIEKSTEQFSYSVELKSLNSRYLEIVINLPRILRNEENLLNGYLKNSFSRGKLELTVEIFSWTAKKPVSLNSDLIKNYYNELKKIHRDLKIAEPIKFESILGLDGVTQKEHTVISEKSFKDILKTVNDAVKKTIEMRKKEGRAIKQDIIKSIGEIVKEVAKIKKLSKNSVNEKMIKLKKRIDELSENRIDDNRLYSEIAILADKLDINEEIIRLNDHLKKFRSVVNSREQIGKKLDFVAQEIFREINTISSKSNNSEIAHIVVDVKNYIDKIREHSRNIV